MEPRLEIKMDRTIAAETYYGETISVSFSDLFHRVSVYCIILDQDRLLMVRTSNNKWYFPGGGLEIGEAINEGLAREAREELNAEIEVGALLHADEVVYYHDPNGIAAQLVRLYYACRTTTHEFHSDNAEERNEFLGIGWVSLNNLDPNEFLPSTYRALLGIKTRLDG